MIDEVRLLNNLKDFSFPRLSGTDFEKKSFNIAKKKIEELNLSPMHQDFSFSIFYSRIYPKVALTLLSWLLLVVFLNLKLIFNIVNLSIIFILILILMLYTRNPEKIKVGREYHSQNLFLKLASQTENESSDYNIFLLSHLDSKGQAFSIKIRIQLYYVWIITFPLGLLFSILNSFFLIEDYLLLKIITILSLCFNLTAIIILWMNKTNNISKGAIDNASGISCVLELLYYYSNVKERQKNCNLWFVFTGAEESGTMGIRNFYRNIKNFDRDKTFIINFDSIAKKVNLWDHGLLNNKYFKSFNYIIENKDIMSLEKKTYRFYIGTYSDGLFLLNKKFKGIGNGDRSTYNYVHSKNDDLDKIDVIVLKKLCQFYTILLNEVDMNLKN
ncbi:MAG: M28 family peptidase [Candidatus Hermodarchaeota archaeon]